jgi:tubulin polyglutamylase TTLL1/tubulin monoglycylase TTLL3/8
MRSLIRIREPNLSLDGDLPVNSIPSRDAPVDKSLVANGFQVALLSIPCSNSPVRQVERKIAEPNLHPVKEKRHASQVFNYIEHSRKFILKSEAKLTALKVQRSRLKSAHSNRTDSTATNSQKATSFVSSRTDNTTNSARDKSLNLVSSSRAEVRRKPEEVKQMSIYRPQMEPRKESIVSWEDAIRDKDWLLKAKEQILKDASDKIARGNGLLVQEGSAYKYFLGNGNNRKLVKDIMQTRWWWSPTEHREEAHFIWTQSRDLEWFQGAEKAETEWREEPEDCKVTCKVRLILDMAKKNVTSTVDISPLNLDALFTAEHFQAGNTRDLSGVRLRTHNKMEHTYHLSNKKALYVNLKNYCEATGQPLFDKVPLTFHIQSWSEDPEFVKFTEAFASFEQEEAGKNLWIVKPGENTNRGTGISVCSSVEQVREGLQATVCEKTGRLHTYIVQRYLGNPYLINKRKFDLRIYALITSINGGLQGYYYSEGYLRTSSKEFTLTNLNRMIHLTNDAVQKKGEDYGRFEGGNKLSYAEFQRYLDANYGQPVSFLNDVLPKIVGLMQDTMLATFTKLDPEPKTHSFEVYGYDFMLDTDLRPWLIEVNTNPCLELSANTLARVIPAMLDNAFFIAVDPYFPEPRTTSKRYGSHYNKHVKKNMFQLIFNSRTDGAKLIEQCRAQGTLDLLLAVDPSLEELSKDEDEIQGEELAS